MSLVISDLSKSRHGTSLLNGVNLELRSGAIHGLFGRNGAGKSTLLNIIANRLVADAGSVSFDGNRMTDGGGMWERLMLMDETWPYPVEWRLRSVFRLISRRYGGFDDVLAGRMMQAFGLRPDVRFMRLSTGHGPQRQDHQSLHQATRYRSARKARQPASPRHADRWTVS